MPRSQLPVGGSGAVFLPMLHRAASKFLQSVPGRAFSEASSVPRAVGCLPPGGWPGLSSLTLPLHVSRPPTSSGVELFRVCHNLSGYRGIGCVLGAVADCSGPQEGTENVRSPRAWLQTVGGGLVTTPLLGFSCVVPIGPSPFLWEAPQEPAAGDRGCGFGPKLLSPRRICEESHSPIPFLGESSQFCRTPSASSSPVV